MKHIYKTIEISRENGKPQIQAISTWDLVKWRP